MKKMILICVAAVVAGICINSAYAMCGMCDMMDKKHGSESSSKEAVDAGNTICPVSGEHIKEGEAIKVEHEGKSYNLCCKMCEKDFKKDPKKYIEKLEAIEEKEPAQHEGHTGHAH